MSLAMDGDPTVSLGIWTVPPERADDFTQLFAGDVFDYYGSLATPPRRGRLLQDALDPSRWCHLMEFESWPAVRASRRAPGGREVLARLRPVGESVTSAYRVVAEFPRVDSSL